MNAPEKSEKIALQILSLESNTGEQNKISHLSQAENVTEQRNPTSQVDAPSVVSLDSRDESSFDPNFVSKSMVVYESNGAKIINPRIESLDKKIVNLLCNGQKYRVCYQVKFDRDCENVRFRCMLKTMTGVELGGGTYPAISDEEVSVTDGQIANIYLEFMCNFNPGTYFINCGLSGGSQSLHRIIDALVFRVTELNSSFSFGVVDFNFKSNIEFYLESGSK
jgi:lipopolysaccharide transport system ATP-binding protein